MWMYVCTGYSIPPHFTSSADSLQSSNVTRLDTLQTGQRQKRVHAQQNPASCSKKRAMSPQNAGVCVCVKGPTPCLHVLCLHELRVFLLPS